MKLSLATTALIFAVAALLGGMQQDRLAAAREARQLVAGEAQALGLSPEALTAAGKPPLPTKSDRGDSPDKIAEARSVAAELIAQFRMMRDLEKSGGRLGEDEQRRRTATLLRFTDFSLAQIQAVIGELQASEDIDQEYRRMMLHLPLSVLAADRPESALEIITGDPSGIGTGAVSGALAKWAEKDPLAALEWMRRNSEKHADLITESAKVGILAGAAKQDPKLALRLVGDLRITEFRSIAPAIAEAVRTPEQRSALLAALRSGEMGSELAKEIMGALGGQLTVGSFQAGEAWLATAKLDEQEAAAVASGISSYQPGADTGRWVEWMSDKVPSEVLDRKVNELVGQWTRRDFNATATWINGTPEGPAKTAAVKSFARTVAPHEPASAAQWAETLPAGKDRDSLFKTIHTEWKKQDQAAAATFAARHGLPVE